MTRQYVSLLVKEGKLDTNPKRQVKFSQVQALLNKTDLTKETQDSGSEYWVEKTKHERAKRQLAELELKNRLNGLIPADVIQSDLEAMYGAFKKRLYALVEDAGPLLMGNKSTPELQTILWGLVYEALEDCAGYDPETGRLTS